MKMYDHSYWNRYEDAWPALARRHYIAACGLAVEQLLAEQSPSAMKVGQHADEWRDATDSHALWRKLTPLSRREANIVGRHLNELIRAELDERIGSPREAASVEEAA